MYPKSPFLVQLPPLWVLLFLGMVQRPIVHLMGKEWLALEWSCYGEIMKKHTLVQVIVLFSPTPVNIREAIIALEIASRPCNYTSEIAWWCWPILQIFNVIIAGHIYLLSRISISIWKSDKISRLYNGPSRHQSHVNIAHGKEVFWILHGIAWWPISKLPSEVQKASKSDRYSLSVYR